MKKLLLLALVPLVVWAQQSQIPVPKDPFNTPIYGGLGHPYVMEGVTVTSSSYQTFGTLNQNPPNSGRNYRSIIIYNPDTTRSVYACVGDSSSCSTDMLVVPPDFALAADNVLMGPTLQDTTVWLRLDSAGSVQPKVMVW